MDILVLVLLTLIGGSLYWTDRTEESCWQHEATQAFENYERFKTRSAILRATMSTGREVTNPKLSPVEVIESDPNGCSLGSNGQTVLRLYFDNSNKLTKIQVFRNYLTGGPSYQMELIEERSY